MRKSVVRGTFRSAGFLLLNALLIPVFAAIYPLGKSRAMLVRRLWCRLTCLIMGIRVKRFGEPFRGCPTVYVSNHVSYIDIAAIGAIVDATFIAKSEVAGWPFFGHLAKLTGTMFVKRHWRQALVQRNRLASCLYDGEDFVLFGEGTSSNGMAIRPFKTSLLSVAEPWIVDRPIAVQPFTLVYTQVGDGTPIDAANCDLYAWWGNAKLMPHLWRLTQLPGVELQIHIGPPVLSWSVTSRKILARELREQLVHNLHSSRGLSRPEALRVAAPRMAT